MTDKRHLTLKKVINSNILRLGPTILEFCFMLIFADCLVREQCDAPEDCGTGACMEGRCVTGRGLPEKKINLTCPGDMIAIDNRFCMDKYEAARIDADSAFMGYQRALGASRQGVLPWEGLDYTTARTACESKGKRLCEPSEWRLACSGPNNSFYCYGDEYMAGTCNSIDSYCDSIYNGCFNDCYDCYPYHVAPTGSFPACVSFWGVYDLCGNLWEWVDSGYVYTETDSIPIAAQLRGGAYNCGMPGAPVYMLSCDYNGGAYRPASGFRCCHDGEEGR